MNATSFFFLLSAVILHLYILCGVLIHLIIFAESLPGRESIPSGSNNGCFSATFCI